MSYKKLITYINAENEYPQNVLEAAKKYALEGADEVFLYNYATDDATREEFLHLAKKVGREIEIPFMIGLYVPRFEDMKKGLYTGAERVVVKETLLTDSLWFAWRKKHKIQESKKDEIARLENCVEALKEIKGKIDAISIETSSLFDNLRNSLSSCNYLRGRDYTSFSNEQKQALGTIVNNTKALSVLLNEMVAE